jgi:K+-transporting ATPase KdpF subunit
LAAGLSPRPAIACNLFAKEVALDYVIAGIASLFLFGYLIYALLRPERF